jgi:hypothetical protein
MGLQIRMDIYTRELTHPCSICRHCKATDPRDKVFGLLGLANGDAALSVDYSISVEQLYFRVLQKAMEREHSFSSIELMQNFSKELCYSLMLPEEMVAKGNDLIDSSTIWHEWEVRGPITNRL